MRTRVVIQSRLNSSRLPGKALLTVAGMPLIELVARRASRGGHEVVVATSLEPYDQHIAEHLRGVGIAVVRGPLDDVLGRFLMATEDLEPGDTVVRLTGDNPVLDADVIDELTAAMRGTGHVYGRVDIEQVPEGLGCEVFSVDVLREAAASAVAGYDREHVTPWIRRNAGELLFAPAANPPDLLAYRCTVDSLSDYDTVRRMFAGHSDPVEVPWTTLMDSLTEMLLDAPTLPRAERGGLTQSRIVLGAKGFGASGGVIERVAPDAEQVRAIFAAAVRRGITHVEVGRDDDGAETAVRGGYDPAFKQRIGFVCRLAAVESVPAGALEPAVEASLERSFAELGRRHADVVLAASVDDATRDDAVVWRRLLRYREAGAIGRAGVVLRGPDDVARAAALDGLGYVSLPFCVVDRRWEGVDAELAALAERGVVISVHDVFLGGALASTAPLSEAVGEYREELLELRKVVADAAAALGRTDAADLCLAHVLSRPWVTSATLGVDTEDQLAHLSRLAVAPPLSAADSSRLSELLPAASDPLLLAVQAL